MFHSLCATVNLYGKIAMNNLFAYYHDRVKQASEKKILQLWCILKENAIGGLEIYLQGA